MSFQDIKGQDKPIRLIKGYLNNQQFEGSYLFTGEEGVGKKFVAKTLAKALNCESQGPDSCDRCASCLKIERGQHPDIHIIESPDSFDLGQGKMHIAEETEAIKIEYIRQLRKDINLKPFEAKKKVFIIDNAHKLTTEAQNALLKILEEPPQASLIILISAKPALLLKTIVSRCKAIKFYPLPRTGLEEILKNDHRLDNNLAHYLAYFCEGRIGRALKLKDAGILMDKNRVIDAFISARKTHFYSLSSENRINVRGYLNTLAAWFRDMYLIKTGAPHRELINLDRKEELLRLMHRYTFVDLYEILNSISGSLLYLERNINVRLLLSNLREVTAYGAK